MIPAEIKAKVLARFPKADLDRISHTVRTNRAAMKEVALKYPDIFSPTQELTPDFKEKPALIPAEGRLRLLMQAIATPEKEITGKMLDNLASEGVISAEAKVEVLKVVTAIPLVGGKINGD